MLLYETRDRESKDPRDKIHALLGLMFEAPSTLVRPDYMLPVEQVYANFTCFMIAAEGSLDVVCTHNPRELQPELPSWAPDLRTLGRASATPLIDPSGCTTMFNVSVSNLAGAFSESPTIHRNGKY
jgi:hypothetical protein